MHRFNIPLARRITKRSVALAVLCAAVLSAFAEASCRVFLGLGNPPLSIADPEIEYLFAPNQLLHRFGNRIEFNSYSMRSGEILPSKRANSGIRILVFGDSVVNGGALTDQSDLATELLHQRLKGRNVEFVGNVSAGSWGPPNHLAYVKKHGFFDADICVFVYSSHDYYDLPLFHPLDPLTHPTEPPASALSELWQRYVPGAMNLLMYGNRYPASAEAAPATEHASAHLQELFSLAKAECSHVFCLQYLERKEIEQDSRRDGFREIRQLATLAGVPVADTADFFHRDGAEDLFRDDIHPTTAGQFLLAEQLELMVAPAVKILNDANNATFNVHRSRPPVPVR